MSLIVAVLPARGADVVLFAQADELGQELQRLEREVRAPVALPREREVPPEVVAELGRAAEAAADEAEASVAEAAEAADQAMEESQADAEDAAARLLDEIEAGQASAGDEPGADAAEAEAAEEETPPAEMVGEETEEPAEDDAEMDEGADEGEPASSTRRTRATRGRGGSYEITEVSIDGDVALLESLGLLDLLKQEVMGQTLGEREIRDIARRYNKLLVDEGYYLARMFTPPTAFRDLQGGKLTFEIDQGRVGKTAFYQEVGGEKIPYRGKYFSEKQLQRRLGNVREDEPFLYDEFYKSVFTVNSHPDLTMDTDLKVRKEREGSLQRRFVDMDFTVKERIPIHAVVEVQNSGTKATEEWRAAFTVQHLNLTKHDDVLTLTLPTSIDFSTVRSLAGSYYLPHYVRNGGSFTLYGGYSELDTEDLVQDVDLQGTGWFAGVQGTYKLIANDLHTLNISLGYAHQVIEDTLILGDSIDTPREVTIGPISLVASYSSVRPDRLGGRNFLTSQFSWNQGGFLGSSDDEEIVLQRETAEADYWIERLQFARIQPLSFREPDPDQQARQWIVFFKLDGQYASGALIPAEQKAVGGLDNVRGYEEREILGDIGVSGTIELRSPIVVGNFTSRFGDRPDAAGSGERLQAVLFVDGAQMYLEDTLPQITDSFTMLSVGAGLRAAVTKYAQFKFDYGFPLEETIQSDSGGRAHLSAELQF